MTLVSPVWVACAAAGGEVADKGMLATLQAPHIARQNVNAFCTLQPCQDLAGRGSVFDRDLNSARGEDCHPHQRA